MTPRRRPARSWLVTAGFGLALAMFVAIAAIAWYNTMRLAEGAILTRQAWEVRSRIGGLQRRMADVAAGVRGFVLTADDSFLEPLRQAEAGIAVELGQLRPLIMDPVQRRRLEVLQPLLSSRLEAALEIAALGRGNETEVMMAGLAASRALHDRIIAELDAMSVAQEEILDQRESDGRGRARFTAAAFVLGGGLALLCLGGALLLLVRNASERRGHERDMAFAEARLRAQAVQLARIYALSLDAICEIDAGGRFLSVSPACERIWGYSAAELVGQPYIDKVLPEDRQKSLEEASAVMAGRATVTFTNHYLRKDGAIVDILWSAQWSEADQIMVCIAHDITQRQRLTAELQQHAEALRGTVAELAVARDRAEAADRLKSAFLATMSHELRTPLNSIIGFTGLLLQRLPGPLTAEQTRQLEMVRASGRHLLALINDVLDISKLEAGQLAVQSEPVDARAAIDKVAGVVRPLAEQKGLTLTVEIAPAVDTLVADARRLEQVLLNLLSNAIKFTPQGAVGVTARVAAGALEVAVADTGIGIRPEDLQELFRPFHQVDTGLSRAHEGTGLGLAISRRLAQLMGGDIAAESEPGRGSRFTLHLPLHQEKPA